MFGTMTNGSTWSAPAPAPAAGLPDGRHRHLETIVGRALRGGLGPPELVRWVRATAADFSADGVADGEPLTRCVAQALRRALRRPTDTLAFGGQETWLRTAAQ
jgi:hypothetical protein